MSEQLNNKVWLVTGTSSGIGLELVKSLLTQGYKVSALTRKPEELEKEIISNKENLLILKTDITNDENVKKVVQDTINHFGEINVVVNNAAFGIIGSVEELSDKEYRYQFDVNVFGTLNVLRHVIPFLRNQKSGTIINVSSSLGWNSMGLYSAYTASKHAINGITLSLQKELKPFNINVILASPGTFRTPFINGGNNFQSPENYVQEYQTEQLLGVFQKYSPYALGDPVKAANVLIEAVNSKLTPEILFIGTDSMEQSKQSFEYYTNQVDKSTSLPFNSTKFADDENKIELPKF